MAHYKITVPPTMEMGSYSAVISTNGYSTRSQEALQDYNSARDHDGLPHLRRMPKGTKYKRVK